MTTAVLSVVSISAEVRSFYVWGGAIFAVLVLIAMDVFKRLRDRRGARRIPYPVHASMLLFAGSSVATAIIYGLMPETKAEQWPSVVSLLFRVRDLALGLGVILNVSGLLWMAWPRRGGRQTGKARPVSLREGLIGDVPHQAQQQQLHRAPL